MSTTTHTDSGRWRSVWIGPGVQGSLLRTHCGLWLPGWLDGPDGEENRLLWAIYTDAPPTCPVCLERS